MPRWNVLLDENGKVLFKMQFCESYGFGKIELALRTSAFMPLLGLRSYKTVAALLSGE